MRSIAASPVQNSVGLTGLYDVVGSAAIILWQRGFNDRGTQSKPACSSVQPHRSIAQGGERPRHGTDISPQ